MNERYVHLYLMDNQKYFEKEAIPYLTQALYELPDEAINTLNHLKFNSPYTGLGLSVFLGGIGVDRFYVGDIGMGVFKLLTAGGFGFVTIYDWFTCLRRTKRKNYDQFMEHIASYMGGTYTPHLTGDAFSGSFIYRQNGKYCPSCGTLIHDDQDYCPHCGYRL